MTQTSKIEWTEATWNPVVGCTKVSDGCTYCYAEPLSNRLAGMARKHLERVDRKSHYLHVISKGKWNNSIRVVPEALEDPLRWGKPRLVFVNSMSDLFHKHVPLDFIKQIFEVMNNCQRHTFQILTKRPEIAAEYASQLTWTPNIWMGTSVENESVTSRIDALRNIDAKIQFLSLEPLLGPLSNLNLNGIHWVITGGESGPKARPMQTEWVRDIRNQCIREQVPFFFKQWGGRNKKQAGRILDGQEWNEMPEQHQDPK